MCIGLNYRDHAEESELDIPAQPVIFAKWATSLIGHGETIVIPREETRPDYEGELAIVIGERCRHVPRASALSVVAGAFFLPAEVDALFWPGSGPDATYPAWLFLLLTAASFVLYAVLGGPIIRAFRAILDSLQSGDEDDHAFTSVQVSVMIIAIVLTVSVWTAIAFPDDRLGLRYAIDAMTLVGVLTGTLLIGARRLRSDAAGARDGG